jgi:hypothetical protein
MSNNNQAGNPIENNMEESNKVERYLVTHMIFLNK